MIRYHAVHQDAMAADPDGEWVRFSEASTRNAEQRARIAELEAKQERLIGWLVEASQIPCTELWTFKGWRVSAGACEAAIREAIETPNSGERREGEK
jgi:hypothetical protein